MLTREINSILFYSKYKPRPKTSKTFDHSDIFEAASSLLSQTDFDFVLTNWVFRNFQATLTGLHTLDSDPETSLDALFKRQKS